MKSSTSIEKTFWAYAILCLSTQSLISAILRVVSLDNAACSHALFFNPAPGIPVVQILVLRHVRIWHASTKWKRTIPSLHISGWENHWISLAKSSKQIPFRICAFVLFQLFNLSQNMQLAFSTPKTSLESHWTVSFEHKALRVFGLYVFVLLADLLLWGMPSSDFINVTKLQIISCLLRERVYGIAYILRIPCTARRHAFTVFFEKALSIVV